MIRFGLTMPSLLLFLAAAPPARADEAVVASPAEVAKPANEQPAERVTSPAATAAPVCEPAHPPVYIEDWGRLAALTQSDALVTSKADFWARRREQANWVLGTGLILGGGAAGLGTVDGLISSEWSRPAKWQIAGVGLALVSFLAYLAYSPDRDDLLTVINQWNLRHPDRQLAP